MKHTAIEAYRKLYLTELYSDGHIQVFYFYSDYNT